MTERGGPPIGDDVDNLFELLPHRYPIMLVDRMVEMESGKRIVAYKNVSVNEPVFAGHFPGHPIMPGVMVVEGLAQAAGVLVLAGQSPEERRLFYLTTIERARFRKPVLPGDRLYYEVEIVRMRKRYGHFVGRALVDGEVVAEARFSIATAD